jgi:hypothetical protein
MSKKCELKNQLKDSVPKLLDKAIQLALDGNIEALKLLLPKANDMITELEIDISGSLEKQARQILNAILRGDINTSAGNDTLKAMRTYANLVELAEMQRRIDDLEEIIKQPRNSLSNYSHKH